MLSDKELAEGKRRAAKATFLPWGEHDLWWTRSGMAPYDTAKKNAAFAVWAANNAEALIAEVERLRRIFDSTAYYVREAERLLQDTRVNSCNVRFALGAVSEAATHCEAALAGEGGKDGLDGTTGDK